MLDGYCRVEYSIGRYGTYERFIDPIDSHFDLMDFIHDHALLDLDI